MKYGVNVKPSRERKGRDFVLLLLIRVGGNVGGVGHQDDGDMDLHGNGW